MTDNRANSSALSDDILGRFEKLSVSSKPEKGEDKLDKCLGQIGFKVFKVLEDLGYFGWTPSGDSKSLQKVDGREIRRNVSLDKKPDHIHSLSDIRRRLPIPFAHLPPQTVSSGYPHHNYYVASLHVAMQRLKSDRVHFFMGGSALEVLATKTLPDDGARYLVNLVPTTDIIMITKHKNYVKNYSDPGFQFERLVTGKTFRDKHDLDLVEHLQLMTVGGQFNVLFSAEVDAMDSEEKIPIEVNASNPRYWGTRVMFQMISSGSLSLCAGSKSRGTLIDVNMKSLRSVAQEALASSSIRTLERNIVDGVEAIWGSRNELKEGTIFELDFRSSGKLHLAKSTVSLSELFPSSSVVKDLLDP